MLYATEFMFSMSVGELDNIEKKKRKIMRKIR